jgi:methyl-accepting chemotaxis protein
MLMKLRSKVLSGFLILALMLSLAGAWSIYELQSTSSTVDNLLAENYESIRAGKGMVEALEREDSAVLLLLLGRWKEGRDILSSADSLFQDRLRVAANNITIPGESSYIEAIESAYSDYKATWEGPIVATEKEGDLGWYFGGNHAAFVSAKSAVDELVDLNARAMYGTASELRQKGTRAIMPGIVAIVAALVFSLLFSYFVDFYMVGPIVRITAGIGKFLHGDESFDVRLQSHDELSELTDSIQTLIARSRSNADTTTRHS